LRPWIGDFPKTKLHLADIEAFFNVVEDDGGTAE